MDSWKFKYEFMFFQKSIQNVGFFALSNFIINEFSDAGRGNHRIKLSTVARNPKQLDDHLWTQEKQKLPWSTKESTKQAIR